MSDGEHNWISDPPDHEITKAPVPALPGHKRLWPNWLIGVLGLFITILIFLSLWWSFQASNQQILRSAHHLAVTAYADELVYRAWQLQPRTSNANYENFEKEQKFHTETGLWQSLETAQNIQMPHGSSLSVKFIGSEPGGFKIKPDPGEAEALLKFDAGEKESSGIINLDQNKIYRFIKPLPRGLNLSNDDPAIVSIMVPLDNLTETARLAFIKTAAAHLGGWVLVLALLLQIRAMGRLFGAKPQNCNLASDVKFNKLAFFDNSSCGLYIKTFVHDQVAANKRLADILNCDYELLTGPGLARELAGKEFYGQLKAMEELVVSTRAPVEELVEIKNSDKIYEVSMFPILGKNENIEALGVMLHEAAAYKNLKNSLNKAETAATETALKGNAFLANTSHDLRTPLNVVIGLADLLSRFDLGSEQASMAEVIKKNGEEILRVLNDMLDYTRLESGQMVLTTLPFSFKRRCF